MTTTPIFPPLDEASIKIIKRNLDADPEYLNHPSCPYSETAKGLFAAPISTDSEGIVNNLDKQIQILNKLDDQLSEQSRRFDAGELPSSEVNAFFKQRITISREIIELQKELSHVENVDALFAKVLEIMEDSLDADQKSQIMQELKAVIDKES